MKNEIWEANDDRADLWETAPDRAARRAYLELVMMWAAQVEEGQYRGIPCPHRLSKKRDRGAGERGDQSPDPPRESGFTRDSAGGAYRIPAEVLMRWKQAA